mmetsp:Transcript_47789/g.136703  ORF Transcript_47789/g.136703 Transcript_47789/m.136703 type:complete len:207 (-) Transcript_47789:148-768(-)
MGIDVQSVRFRMPGVRGPSFLHVQTEYSAPAMSGPAEQFALQNAAVAFFSKHVVPASMQHADPVQSSPAAEHVGVVVVAVTVTVVALVVRSPVVTVVAMVVTLVLVVGLMTVGAPVVDVVALATALLAAVAFAGETSAATGASVVVVALVALVALATSPPTPAACGASGPRPAVVERPSCSSATGTSRFRLSAKRRSVGPLPCSAW